MSREVKDRPEAAEAMSRREALVESGVGREPAPPGSLAGAGGGAAGGGGAGVAAEADALLTLETLRATKNFEGLARFLTSSSEAVRSRAAAKLRVSSLATEGADRDAVKTALRGSTAETAASLLSWIEGWEADEAEFRRKAAQVARWEDAKDVRALLWAVTTVEERSDVRVLTAVALWGVWESDAGERSAIEAGLGLAAELTEESRALQGRIRAAKKAVAERAREKEAERQAEWTAEMVRRLNPSTIPMKSSFSLAGHTRPVNALLAHPFFPLLVSSNSGGDCNVRVWDLDTRALLRTLVGHGSSVWGLALDPAGRRLASGSVDATVKLWDLDSGACLRTLEDPSMSYVNAVAWDAAGALVASGSTDHDVRVWDADSGALRHTLAGHSGPVCALAARPADDLLASGSDDRTVRVWRWSSGARVRKLAGHEGVVTSLAASAAWLVSGSVDKSVRVWSWTSEACVRVLDGFAGKLWLNSLSWRDSTLVTLDWSDEGTVRVWDASAADASAWSCVGSLASKASSGNGVAAAGGGLVACAAAGDSKTIAVWGV